MVHKKIQYQNVLNGIRLLFIVLFLYAATSKLLTFETFQGQLERSPYISAHSNWLVWGIPGIEYLISILLLFPKHLLTGLYMSLGLMTLFTGYIYIVLNFSDSKPCSCGGVISSLDWKEHLIFNLFFITLALIGILILHQQQVNYLKNNTT